MAKKSGNGNGHGNGKDPVVTAIHELTAELRTTRAEWRAELHGLRLETAEGFAKSNARFESIEQVLRGHGRQLEALHAGQAEIRDEARQTNARLAKVEDGLAGLRAEVHEGFAELGQKITSAAERDRHLEGDLRTLGERVARLEARVPETR